MRKATSLVTGLVSAALFLQMCCPTSAWATIEGDQTPATEEEISQAIESGQIGSGDSEQTPFNISDAGRASSYVQEFSGDTRYDTASMQALAAYPSSEYVIVAGNGAWPDALAATGLAGVLDCPVLLTEREQLTPRTAETIKRLGAKRAVLLGGDLRVTDAVRRGLESLGLRVDRLAGETRQDTQMMVYDYGKSAPNGASWSGDMVAFASGYRFHDALSFSPVAFSRRVPVFLLDESGDLAAGQRAALSGRRFSSSVVLGGRLASSDSTVAFAGSVSGSGRADRIAGETRFDTSAQLAAWAVSRGYLSWDGAAFATDALPYDALAGGVLQGKSRSVVLMVDGASGSGPAVSAAAAHRGSISSIRFFGGELSICRGARMNVVHQMGQRYSVLPNYKVYIDAGHGQNDSNNGKWDPGAVANGYREADLTADLARRVGGILRNEYGVDCYVNDRGGWYKLRQSDAKSRGCTSLVSIHFNSGGGTGSETLRHSLHAAPSSADLQSVLHRKLVGSIGLSDRGMKTQQVAVLSGDLPATLLEICFIDNANDMRVYQANKDEIAHAIAEGIALA